MSYTTLTRKLKGWFSMATCARCHEEKPREEFHKCSYHSSGINSYCKSCNREQRKIWRKQNPERVMNHTRSQRLKNPEKDRAYASLYMAVKTGKVHKSGSCEMCGKQCFTYGHHYDYSKPLEVTWLCRKCHANIHHSTKPLSNQIQERL